MHSTDLAPVLSATSNRVSVWIISLFPTCILYLPAPKPTNRNQSWTRHSHCEPLAMLQFGQILALFQKRSLKLSPTNLHYASIFLKKPRSRLFFDVRQSCAHCSPGFFLEIPSLAYSTSPNRSPKISLPLDFGHLLFRSQRQLTEHFCIFEFTASHWSSPCPPPLFTSHSLVAATWAQL